MSIFERTAVDVWHENPLLAYAYGDFQDFAENFAVASGSKEIEGIADGRRLAFLELENAVKRRAAASRPISHPGASFSYAAKRGNRLVLWLYGSLTVAAPPIIAALEQHADAAGILLRVDCMGGSVLLEDHLFRAIVAHRAKKLAIVDRACWSAALLPTLACGRVYIRATGSVLVHGVQKTVCGDATKLREAAAAAAMADRQWLRTVAGVRPQADRRLLATLKCGDFYLSATQAVDLGLADRVIHSLPPPPLHEAGRHHTCAEFAPVSPIEDIHV